MKKYLIPTIAFLLFAGLGVAASTSVTIPFFNGNYGFGTSSPVAKLTIVQSANSATSSILIAPAPSAPAGWTQQTGSGSINWGDSVYSYDIVISDDGLVIAGLGSAFAPDRVQLSIDGGVTWSEEDLGSFTGFSAIAMSADGSRIVVTEEGTGKIYYSTDTGSTWSSAVTTGSPFTLVAIASSDNGMKLVATNNEGGGIYTSTNGGASWNADTTYLGTAFFVDAASSADGAKLAIADEQMGSGGHIYTSTNSGSSWTEQTSSPSIIWRGLTSSSDGVKLAGVEASGYVYTSTDSGATWTQQTGSGSRAWTSISSSADGQTLVASADSSGYLYISVDGGVNWVQQTSAGARNWRGADISGSGSNAVAVPRTGYAYTYSGSIAFDNREMYIDENNTFRIGVGADSIGITSDGSLGVGTTTPTQKLQVEGGYIQGAYKSSDGTSGFTGSGTSCTITAIKDGLITGASCS